MSCFGPHLTLELYDVSGSHIRSTSVIEAFLLEVSRVVGSPPVSETMITVQNENRNTGISGTIQLASGHVCIRTYEEVKVVFMDVFCRRDYDAARVIEAAQSVFGTTDSEGSIIVRGRKSLQEMLEDKKLDG